MKSFKPSFVPVEVRFVKPPQKVPMKAIKTTPESNGDETKTPSIADKVSFEPAVEVGTSLEAQSITVSLEDPLTVEVWDVPVNRNALKLYEEMKSFAGKEIADASEDDVKFAGLETWLLASKLGQVLGRTITCQFNEDPITKTEDILSKIADDEEALKLYQQIEQEKSKTKPWLKNWVVPSEVPSSADETVPEVSYECPSCKVIWKGSEINYNICPKCKSILQEVVRTRLGDINAALVNKRVHVRAVLEGEGEAKAVFPAWNATCSKCSTQVEPDFRTDALKEKFFETLVAQQRFGAKEIGGLLSVLGNASPCSKGGHEWRVKPMQAALDFREIYLRDELLLQEKDIKGPTNRNYKIVLFGPSPIGQQIEGSGIVLINPQDNRLMLVVDSYEESSMLQHSALSDEDKDVLRKFFHEKTLEQFLGDYEPLVCPQIAGRSDAKLASLLTAVSPLWISDDGSTPTPGFVRTLFPGDPRTGKGTVERWYPETVRVGLHSVAETSSRAGLSFYVDPETNIVVWGLLPEADMSLAIIEGLHGLPFEQMIQFREILAQGKVEVRMKAKGLRFARTRIMADANPPESMEKYLFPCQAIKNLRCFLDPVDITRWDLFIPFRDTDIRAEQIVNVNRGQNEQFIESLRKLIALAWSRKIENFNFDEKAKELWRQESIRLINEYAISEIPLIHNGSKWTVLRLACSFAVLSLSTEDYESFDVEEQHVKLAVGFMEQLLSQWELPEFRNQQRKGAVLNDEKYAELKSFIEGDEKNLVLFREIILSPSDGEIVSGRAGIAYSTARKVFSELKTQGLIGKNAKGYLPTGLGLAFYKKYTAQETIRANS